MTHYIAIVHKDAASCYGVQFPDLPGVITAGDTLDDAYVQAIEALAFAAEDWTEVTGTTFPTPRSIEDIRARPDLAAVLADGVLIAVPFNSPHRAAAE